MEFFFLVCLLLPVLIYLAGLPVFSSAFGEQPEMLSDEEFVARCPPGTRREVALKVRAIVSEQLGIPEEQIHPEHRFVEDLKAD